MSNPEIEHQVFISLAENSAEFFGISDLSFKPIYINPAGLRRVGLDSFEQAAQRSVLEFFFPEDRTFIQEEFFSQVQRDGHGEVEIRFRHFKTGEPIWMIYTVFVVHDKDGKVIGYGTVSSDITEHKKLEEALQRSDWNPVDKAGISVESHSEIVRLNHRIDEQTRYFEAILSSISDFAYTFDKQGRFVFVNQALLNLWGLKLEQAIGKNFFDLDYPDDLAARLQRQIQQVYDTRQRVTDETPYTSPTGIAGYYEYIFSPFFAPDGTVELVVGTTRNITKLKQLEKSLREEDRRKDEFLATLAHELRNPLAPIRSGLEILRRIGDDKEKREEILETIERQTSQVVHLVDDLLDISRITQGKINLRKERIQLKTAIEMALEASQELIDEAENEITVTLPFKPIYIDADLTRITQIFLNILSNAAKYSDPGGKIQLTAAKENGYAVVNIKDTGLGIPPELIPKIFDMFGQIETPDEQANRGGLGIGLSVVKKLVEMHGGTVEAFSEGEGKGSEFVVRLPLAFEQEKPAPAPSERDIIQTVQAGTPDDGDNKNSDSQTEARRILVVDDNKDAAEMLETLLLIEGHIVRKALEAAAAIKIAEAFQPEISLLDIGLPGMNGYELAVQLRKLLPPESLLISVSGWGQEEDRRRSKEAGIDYHLVKPIDIQDVLKLIGQQKD